MVTLAIAAFLAALQDPAVGPPVPPEPSSETTVALPPMAVPAESEVEPPAPVPAAAAPAEPARESARILPPATEERSEGRKLLDRPEPGPGLGGFLLWSGVVMALLAGTFVLLRRFARGSRFLAGGGAIDVLARKPLGQKQEVFLVSVGTKVFLVGSTRDRLATLGEFSGPDEVASLRASLAGARAESAGAAFRASLREGLSGTEEAGEGREAYASIADEIAGIRRVVRAWRV